MQLFRCEDVLVIYNVITLFEFLRSHNSIESISSLIKQKQSWLF